MMHKVHIRRHRDLPGSVVLEGGQEATELLQVAVEGIRDFRSHLWLESTEDPRDPRYTDL